MSGIDELTAAVEAGDREAVEEMLKDDATLARQFDKDGATPLHTAAFHGRQEIVDILLKAGADINARDKEYSATPAGWAIHYLRERGALLAIEIEDLRFAIERGDVAWVERLVTRHPGLAKAVDGDGVPLIDRAASNPEIARVLKQHPLI